MYTRNLLSYNYKVNVGAIIIRKINLIKIQFLLLFLIIFLIGIMNIVNSFEREGNASRLAADLKTDISMLSETAGVLEIERTSDKHSEINQFGSDGKVVAVDEIKPELSSALAKILDMDKDGELSDKEIKELGIMRLEPSVFQKGLKELQFNLISSDHNFKNFIIITKGKYAGTIFYNGSLKFVDDEHKRYFGLELSVNV